MKTILNLIATGGLLVAPVFAQPQPRYLITDLGPAGSPFAQATALNNHGSITGLAVGADGNQHAIMWVKGKLVDISSPGFGGPNSGAFGVNEAGAVLVQGDGSSKDPNNENFCGYGTGLKCLPGIWQKGSITLLPLLGGNNGTVGGINNRGEAVGAAQNNTRDPDCPAGKVGNGLGPLVLDYKPVLWGPKEGAIRELPLIPGDTVGMAMAINDNGQAVGLSGTCATVQLPGPVAGPHAVLWDTDGSVLDLGNLGGTTDPTLIGAGNAALAINNRGDVVGGSTLHDNKTFHPYLWTRKTGMQDLGLLEGDNVGAGLAINNQGDVVGASIAGSDPLSGMPRAALWQNHQRYDLNELAPGSPLYLLTAFGINDSDEIVGFGVDGSGNLHGFLATPAHTKASASPKDVTVTQSSIQLDATQSTSADGKPLTYTWSIPQGYPSVAISRGTTATPTVTFPLTRGTYQFILTVTDSSGGTSTDTVTVNFMGE